MNFANEWSDINEGSWIYCWTINSLFSTGMSNKTRYRSIMRVCNNQYHIHISQSVFACRSHKCFRLESFYCYSKLDYSRNMFTCDSRVLSKKSGRTN